MRPRQNNCARWCDCVRQSACGHFQRDIRIIVSQNLLIVPSVLRCPTLRAPLRITDAVARARFAKTNRVVHTEQIRVAPIVCQRRVAVFRAVRRKHHVARVIEILPARIVRRIVGGRVARVAHVLIRGGIGHIKIRRRVLQNPKPCVRARGNRLRFQCVVVPRPIHFTRHNAFHVRFKIKCVNLSDRHTATAVVRIVFHANRRGQSTLRVRAARRQMRWRVVLRLCACGDRQPVRVQVHHPHIAVAQKRNRVSIGRVLRQIFFCLIFRQRAQFSTVRARAPNFGCVRVGAAGRRTRKNYERVIGRPRGIRKIFHFALRDFFRRAARRVRNPQFGIQSVARDYVREFVARARPCHDWQNARAVVIRRNHARHIVLHQHQTARVRIRRAVAHW